ncbi:glutamate-5-semialdehyde dehydrogenase [Helicobacter monodelphidis]|uniref:glutamate-5-semialdehyde dehydrogenase n=1 Tax=Helicobacter sp. 15-1451 TaxID=2004995 RepID=UPI000DCC0F87|nr:glutamate-5-semialdehyde dehydrogenase [Helicobacter sp. 15-1451]RAX57673.1 glutamate-5-semialdehyde dehydrogenase [Helicobacter sp. 15-1451]
MNLHNSILKTKQSTQKLLALNSKQRTQLLECMAENLIKAESDILQANQKDIEIAQKNQMKDSMLERLSLDSKKIQAMCKSVQEIASLREPLGRVLDGFIAPSGIAISKISVPLGVVAVIYESRPNVTSDTAALCLKSGNAIILKGGKESHHSNVAITKPLHKALDSWNLPQELIFMLPNSSREEVTELLTFKDLIDVVIPRGGEGLVRYVSEHSSIPVIKHDKGICHAYVHTQADFKKAVDIIINAKTSRPSVCNSIETLLVDRLIFQEFLSFLKPSLIAHKVQCYCCPASLGILEGNAVCEESYHTEYGEKILNVRVVEDIDEAIEHINHYGSQHSDVIITDEILPAEKFLNEVNSACVYLNASTRFSDGGEFGFGAEIGISTNKLHARGPVGIQELTSYKFIIRGNGEVR